MIKLKTAQRLHEAAEKMAYELVKSKKVWHDRSMLPNGGISLLDSHEAKGLYYEGGKTYRAFSTDELLALLPDNITLWKRDDGVWVCHNVHFEGTGDTPSEALANLYEYLILNGYTD